MRLMSDTTLITQHTLNWIHSFIIKYRLCPFAKAPVSQGALRIEITSSKKKAEILEVLMEELYFLDKNPHIETTLLVLAEGCKDFFAYLDLASLAEALIQQQHYEGIYQIATFHPDYYFADTEPDDVANYTNRSPYPMLHLLREERLDQAIAAYGDTDTIPQRNTELMRELGLEQLKKIMLEITK